MKAVMVTRTGRMAISLTLLDFAGGGRGAPSALLRRRSKPVAKDKAARAMLDLCIGVGCGSDAKYWCVDGY